MTEFKPGDKVLINFTGLSNVVYYDNVLATVLYEHRITNCYQLQIPGEEEDKPFHKMWLTPAIPYLNEQKLKAALGLKNE